MDDLGTNVSQMRDNRYEGIIHMVTAADGAQAFYQTENNEARYENIDEAKDKDKKLAQIYMGHRKWYKIDNNVQDFN